MIIGFNKSEVGRHGADAASAGLAVASATRTVARSIANMPFISDSWKIFTQKIRDHELRQLTNLLNSTGELVDADDLLLEIFADIVVRSSADSRFAAGPVVEYLTYARESGMMEVVLKKGGSFQLSRLKQRRWDVNGWACGINQMHVGWMNAFLSSSKSTGLTNLLVSYADVLYPWQTRLIYSVTTRAAAHRYSSNSGVVMESSSARSSMKPALLVEQPGLTPRSIDNLVTLSQITSLPNRSAFTESEVVELHKKIWLEGEMAVLSDKEMVSKYGSIIDSMSMAGFLNVLDLAGSIGDVDNVGTATLEYYKSLKTAGRGKSYTDVCQDIEYVLSQTPEWLALMGATTAVEVRGTGTSILSNGSLVIPNLSKKELSTGKTGDNSGDNRLPLTREIVFGSIY